MADKAMNRDKDQNLGGKQGSEGQGDQQGGRFGGGKQAPGRNPQDDQTTGKRPQDREDRESGQNKPGGGQGGTNR
jgi:hypothetical protein